MDKMKNILTFDTEDWFHANFEENMHVREFSKSNFRQNMDRIFELCCRNNCKATFFVLGCIAEQYPDVVKKIVSEGHEVASHGYSHQLAYSQTYDEFKEDVSKSIKLLEDVAGVKIHGYRAPSWSIVRKNINYLKALEELGLTFDASIFPVKNFLYGIPDANRDIHRPVVDGEELKLREIPTSVFNIMGKGMGYSGGFYFRFFPGFFIDYQSKRTMKKGRPVILYLHPREIDKYEQRITLPPMERFIHYYGIGQTFKKLDKLTRKYEFTSVSEYLKEIFDRQA